MKYLIIILICFITLSCEHETPRGEYITRKDGYIIKVIDSCEYIEYDYGVFDNRVYSLTHKGDCNNH